MKTIRCMISVLFWLGMMIMIPLLPVQAEDGSPIIRINGSETMHKGVLAWADHFRAMEMAKARARTTALEQQLNQPLPPLPVVQFNINASGSGTGIAALLNGHTEIAIASRPLYSKELTLSHKHATTKPVGYVVGGDAVAIIVHPDNPLSRINFAELAAIFRRQDGNIRRWSELGVTVPGCIDQEIKVLSRRISSGTYNIFRETVMGKTDRFRHDMVLLNDYLSIISHVAGDACAIGYASMAYVTHAVKQLCLARQHQEGCILPADARINPNYPLIRPLFMFTLGPPQGMVKSFMDWVIGPDGQAILESQGYLPITPVVSKVGGP